jgi:hypothetical protein
MTNGEETSNIEQLHDLILEIMEIGNIVEDSYSGNTVSSGEKLLLTDLKFKLLDTAMMINKI